MTDELRQLLLSYSLSLLQRLMYLDIPLGLRFPPLAIFMIRQLDTDISGLSRHSKNIDAAHDMDRRLSPSISLNIHLLYAQYLAEQHR